MNGVCAGRTRAWLAAAELSLETESRAKRMAAAREKSLNSVDSAMKRGGRSTPAKATKKKAESKKQKERQGFGQWLSCFIGGGTH